MSELLQVTTIHRGANSAGLERLVYALCTMDRSSVVSVMYLTWEDRKNTDPVQGRELNY